MPETNRDPEKMIDKVSTRSLGNRFLPKLFGWLFLGYALGWAIWVSW